MDNKAIVEGVKRCVREELSEAQNPSSCKEWKQAAFWRAFGAVWCATQLSSELYDEIDPWWKNEMHPKFWKALHG